MSTQPVRQSHRVLPVGVDHPDLPVIFVYIVSIGFKGNLFAPSGDHAGNTVPTCRIFRYSSLVSPVAVHDINIPQKPVTAGEEVKAILVLREA